MGIAVVHTPVRSPEFNVVELVFNKLKTMLKRDKFSQLPNINVPAAIFLALSEISEADMAGFLSSCELLSNVNIGMYMN